METFPRLRVLAWELTRACHLSCRHCRAHAAGDAPAATRWQQMLDQLDAFAPLVLILTGGDPLLHPDIDMILDAAKSRGHRLALASCGFGLDLAQALHLKESGVMRVSLSLDAATAEAHDNWRGSPGSFAAVNAAASACQSAALPFQINTTIHRGNVKDLGAIAKQVQALGAAAWDLFFLVPTGRAAALQAEALDGPEMEAALRAIAALVTDPPLSTKITCAPYSVRLAEETGLAGTACLGGTAFGFLSVEGEVRICGFLEASAGNLLQTPLQTIWQESDFLKLIRNRAAHGAPCGNCGWQQTCGGCRARAYALTGDALAGDPCCPFNEGL